MENENDDINKKAISILNRILASKKELKELQDHCKHEHYTIDFVKGSLVKRCKHCYKVIGYPNEKDKKDAGYI